MDDARPVFAALSRPGHLECLKALEAKGPMTARALAAAADRSWQSVTCYLAELHYQGLVTRVADDPDHVRYDTTTKGLTALAAAELLAAGAPAHAAGVGRTFEPASAVTAIDGETA